MKKTEFDNIIKENLNLNEKLFREAPYDCYYTKEVFKKFKTDMMNDVIAPSAFKSFGDGKGGELDETERNVKKMPPKMASVASSSRFAYLSLRCGAQTIGGGSVEFEHPCKIDGVPGIPPQMDAYSEKGNIFVEVKCHEIFDKHKVVMKEKYQEKIKDFDIYIELTDENRESGTFEISLDKFGINKDASMFDVKQFLCHLMGVKSHSKGKKATLTYLFFCPINDKKQKEIDEVFKSLKDEIIAIFNSAPIRRFCDDNKIYLKAVCEKSRIMEPLTENNIEIIYER